MVALEALDAIEVDCNYIDFCTFKGWPPITCSSPMIIKNNKNVNRIRFEERMEKQIKLNGHKCRDHAKIITKDHSLKPAQLCHAS